MWFDGMPRSWALYYFIGGAFFAVLCYKCILSNDTIATAIMLFWTILFLSIGNYVSNNQDS